jgi:hypothetical protein
MTDNIVDRISRIGNSSCRLSRTEYFTFIPIIAVKQLHMNEDEARALIRLISNLFKEVSLAAGFSERSTNAIMRKFRDAGRRSAPWKPTSSKLPGRPQDGDDGNRILRWLMPKDHKFYASEIVATLVEIKYYLQAFSMEGAPDISDYGFNKIFSPWLLEHELKPGEYHDPVQLSVLNFEDFLNDPRGIQSGHIFPLDRGGIHHPDNTFLMLYRSNQIQGNLTVDELLKLMREIIKKHDLAHLNKSAIELKIRSN